MSAARWERLQADLAAAGVDARVDARTYPGGTAHGIVVRSGAHVLVLRDSWWRDHWTGYHGWVEDREAIAVANMPRSKKRADVVAWSVAALARFEGAATR